MSWWQGFGGGGGGSSGLPGPPGPAGSPWEADPQVASAGQVNYTIPGIPRALTAVAVALDGAELSRGLHFTVSGSVVTLIQANIPLLEAGDLVVLKWQE